MEKLVKKEDGKKPLYPVSWRGLRFTCITLTILPIDLNPITLSTKPFARLSSKLTFDVYITWAPFLISKLRAKWLVSFIFLCSLLLSYFGKIEPMRTFCRLNLYCTKVYLVHLLFLCFPSWLFLPKLSILCLEYDKSFL